MYNSPDYSALLNVAKTYQDMQEWSSAASNAEKEKNSKMPNPDRDKRQQAVEAGKKRAEERAKKAVSGAEDKPGKREQGPNEKAVKAEKKERGGNRYPGPNEDRIKQAESEGKKHRESDPGRAKAWDRLKQKEEEMPRNRDEDKAGQMIKKMQKDGDKGINYKEKGRGTGGGDAARVAGMARTMKKKEGKDFAKQPKTRKKVDSIYNKMLKTKDSEKLGS